MFYIFPDLYVGNKIGRKIWCVKTGLQQYNKRRQVLIIKAGRWSSNQRCACLAPSCGHTEEETATLLLFGFGLAGLVALRKRFNKA